METFLGAIKGVSYGNFPKTSVGKRSWIIANYIQGSGYTGRTLGDIRDYLKRQSKNPITKEKLYASTRMLFKMGYAIKDKKNWIDTIIYENKKFNKI